MVQLDTIKKLSKELPQRDIALAEKFIKNRDFESLLEIVKSDIYLVNKNKQLEQPKEKFLNIDLEKLMELEGMIREYMSYIFIPDNSEDEYWYD